MKTISNDVFRLVNLRGAKENLSIDPEHDDTVDDVDGPVVNTIRKSNFAIGTDGNSLLASLADEMASVEESMDDSNLAHLSKFLTSGNAEAAKVDQNYDFSYGEHQLLIKQLSQQESFRKDFASAYNLWLLAKLYEKDKETLRPLENQIRIGYWIYAVAKGNPNATTPFVGSSYQNKKISLPRNIRIGFTEAKLSKRNAKLKELKRDIEPEKHDSVKTVYQAAKREIETYNKLEINFNNTLAAEIETQEQTYQDEIIQGKHQRGLIPRIAAFLFGRQETRTKVTRSIPTITNIDENLVTKMKKGLSREESAVLDTTLADLGGEPSVHSAGEALSKRKITSISHANSAYSAVLDADRFDKHFLPEPTQEDVIIENGAVQALGWGDLIVAKETLIDYEAREIAHIENILPNEKKNREHTRTKTIEETFESEVTEREESERELETTTRHELQTESEKAINQEFSIKAGVNTSGRYGLTKVQTSLDAGFNSSTQESQKTTTSIAKEIVSKAVERTFKEKRELRRQTTMVEVVDHNLHEINNIPQNGGNSSSISGIYKWVEKVHEIQLRHYGTRMMMEFNIPEPALSIVGRINKIDVSVPEPDKPDFDATGIDESNYLSYAKAYTAAGISPPPDNYIRIGYAWSSQPSESDNANTSEDVLSELVPIPAHYTPINGHFSLSAHPSHDDHFKVRLQIGRRQFSQGGDAIFRRWFTMNGGSSEMAWPAGVPISMTAHGHFDKTLSMNIVITCKRRDAAYLQWQIDTFQAIWVGYERQLNEYKEALEAAQIEQEIRVIPEGSPDAVNRRTEREELQKWSIKVLRREPIELDAVRKVGDGAKSHNEIIPGLADQQASLVRFYEEAFEWDNMSYFFYPYFWGRREAWNIRQSLQHLDYRFETFLRAGASRIIVPVTPGYEAQILFYLANPDLPEKERIQGLETFNPTDEPPSSIADGVYDTMWLELILNKNEELALGSGFLSVTKNNRTVDIFESTWEANDRDIGRELYITGNRYEVESIVTTKRITLTDDYVGDDDPKAAYASGSVAFGPPWIVNLPTNLVILDDNKENVKLQ